MIKRLLFFGVWMVAATVVCSAQQKVKTKKIKKPKAVTTASGLQYTITQKGDGKKPQQGDLVSVHYTGKLTNDTVFDSSVKRGQPFSFKLGTGQVIKGWDEAIALLQVGDKATLRIPPAIGYGEQTMGAIPANSTLIFDVELLDVIVPPKPWDVKGKDTLTTKKGLKYIMVAENKAGLQAKKGDAVVVNYTGYFTDGRIFDSSVERGTPFTFKYKETRVISGWEEAIGFMHKGEKAKLIVPSSLGYGERGAGIIPGNTTLIFDVELIDVKPKQYPKPWDITGKETVTTASGLKYVVISKGNSALKAGPGKMIKAHYTGFLEDGTVFDSSVERGQPIEFPIGQNMVIKGWEEGLSLMSVGDKFKLIIPSELAYGDQGANPSIPPKATLVFDVELVGVTDAPPSKEHEGHDHSDPNHKH